MAETESEARYLIRKGGAYYRPGKRGYTTSAIQAGRYTFADAEQESHPNGRDGPRDNMSFIHEDNVTDEDWIAYRALSVRLAEVKAERDRLRGILDPESWDMP